MSFRDLLNTVGGELHRLNPEAIMQAVEADEQRLVAAESVIERLLPAATAILVVIAPQMAGVPDEVKSLIDELNKFVGVKHAQQVVAADQTRV